MDKYGLIGYPLEHSFSKGYLMPSTIIMKFHLLKAFWKLLIRIRN